MTNLVLVLGLLAAAPAERGGAARPCERLSELALPHTTITLAQTVAAGQFTPPAASVGPNARGGRLYADLPAFCRVAATLAPSADSDIKVEVWLPAAGWNGKFQGVGNGGWSGAISYGALAAAVGRGYAAASTDTGHSRGSGSFALGHPEKLVDFGWRAVHEMTVQGKAVVAAFYGDGPRWSYWTGCSSGGKQGLKEAQRFPADYDGIVAGAPANYWTHLVAASLAVAQANLKDAAAQIPASKFGTLNQAVLEACDAQDGVKDGVLEDPTRCRFDPATLLCKDEDAASCLTAAQVETARKLYGPTRNPKTGRQVFPGLEPGSETGWGILAGGPQPFPIALDHFKYVVFKDPQWDWRTLDLARDVDRADEVDDGTLNATDPDLKAFFGRGGKLLLYHGWSDPLIMPRNSIDYYESVAAAAGGARRVDSSARLFMVPGLGHCGGGPGLNTLNMLGALEPWVEKGQAPDRVVASRVVDNKAVRTRPLCPYPQVARYKGTGSTDEAESFTCQAP